MIVVPVRERSLLSALRRVRPIRVESKTLDYENRCSTHEPRRHGGGQDYIRSRLTRAPLHRQNKCLANFAEGDALRLIAQRDLKALDGFPQRLETEAESLMMYRHDKPRACGICHFHSLLGRAMRADPRVVSANRHDREIDLAVSPQFSETVRHCGIARKNDPPPFSLEQITVVAAIRVALLPGAPVFHREGTNVHLADGGGLETLPLAPPEFGDVTEPCSSQ